MVSNIISIIVALKNVIKLTRNIKQFKLCAHNQLTVKMGTISLIHKTHPNSDTYSGSSKYTFA